jgi:hypothetical protein
MEKRMRTILFAAALLIGAMPASAQHGEAHRLTVAQMQHGPHGTHGRTARADEPAGTRAFREANARMHREMDIRCSATPTSTSCAA